MKIVCSKSELNAGLNIVSKAVPSKTTMSILECILIDCTGGNIKLIANDMDFGINKVYTSQLNLEKAAIDIE